MTRAIAIALVAIGCASMGGCRDRSNDAGATADAAGAIDERDHATLASVVQADATFDEALKRADDAERAGDDGNAARILVNEATPAADAAIATASGATLATPWAQARRDSIVAVLHARRDSIAPYAKALVGDDLNAKLAAVTTQMELQKWAMDAARAALAPPGPAPIASAAPSR